MVNFYRVIRKPWRFLLILAVWMLIEGGACTVLDPLFGEAPPAWEPNLAGVTQTAPPQAQSSLPGWLQVYFSQPDPPDSLATGIDQYVKKDIEFAARTIDVTSFDLNNPTLVDALAAAAKRGVRVRVVYDGLNGAHDLQNAATYNKVYDALAIFAAANIPMVNGGRTYGLMHNKMVIIDGQILYMGSWNLSYNDTYRNNNNLLRITEPRIIANYQGKFDELFVNKRFGTAARYKTLAPILDIDGVRVETYFSPQDKVTDQLVAFVQGAKQQVHYMIFTFTDESLANALIARSWAWLKVEGVIENRGASQGVLPALFCARLPVRLDGNRYTMHHKVLIIDNEIVITGSFNFTRAAGEANDDNVLVIHSPALAALYEQEFQKIYAAAAPPNPNDIKCGN